MELREFLQAFTKNTKWKTKKYKTLEECIEGYKLYKENLKDYYISNITLKYEKPEIYYMLINAEISERELKELYENFTECKIQKFNKILNSDNAYKLE
jgi:hypothetical protein